jgi:hypothetical protein
MAFALHATIDGLVLCARPGALPDQGLQDRAAIILPDLRSAAMPRHRHRPSVQIPVRYIHGGLHSIPASFPFSVVAQPHGDYVVTYEFPTGKPFQAANAPYALSIAPRTSPSRLNHPKKRLTTALGLRAVDDRITGLRSLEERKKSAAGEIWFAAGTLSAVPPPPGAPSWVIKKPVNGRSTVVGKPAAYAQRLRLEAVVDDLVVTDGESGLRLFCLRGGGKLGAVKLAVSNVPLYSMATARIDHVDALYELAMPEIDKKERRYLVSGGHSNAPLRANCPPTIEPPS